MAKLDFAGFQKHLSAFDFPRLFVEVLGWNYGPVAEREWQQDATSQLSFSRRMVAELGGVAVLQVVPTTGWPDEATRAHIWKHLSQRHVENILIFTDQRDSATQSLWYWVKRGKDEATGKPKNTPRRHEYFRGQPVDLFASKLQAMVVELSELDAAGRMPVLEAARRIQSALDVEKTTKRFFSAYQEQHQELLTEIEGIDDERDRRWYASVILNRLMFVWFMQKKGFLDHADYDYLPRQFATSQARGAERFFGEFLSALFFEAFAKPATERTAAVRTLTGDIPYLNGGLFLHHPLELDANKQPRLGITLRISDRAFEGSAVREAWLAYESRFPHLSAYYRAAPEYRAQSTVVNGKKTGSDLNLYKLFLERCFALLRPEGHCGIVIPSGIYTDLGAKGLRDLLFNHSRIEGLFCFENRKTIFEGVDSRFKFVVLTFEKTDAPRLQATGERNASAAPDDLLAPFGGTTRFPAAFMRHDVAELERFPAEGALWLDVDLVRRLSPDSHSVMEFKSEQDIIIAEKLLKHPLLGEKREGEWQVGFTAEFHMTNDAKDLFETEPAEGRLPLYEGKMIWQFDAHYEKPRYWVDRTKGRKALLGRREDVGQWMDYQTYRLGFRDIARNTDIGIGSCSTIAGPRSSPCSSRQTKRVVDADRQKKPFAKP